MIIIYDTETHGLPKNYNISPEHFDHWPRLLEIAWEVWDRFDDGSATIIKKRSELIQLNDWEITDSFALKRFSTKTNNLFGKPINEVLNEFIEDRLRCTYEVGHNLSYDRKIVRAEMFRSGLKQEFTTKKLDTMHSSRSFYNLYKNKPPKLEELYEILFKTKFEDSHTAAADVSATSRCLFELLKRGIIKI